MYTHKQRMKAVKLCIQYGHQLSLAVREFGYPKSTCTLAKWCEEFGHSGELPFKYQRQPKYTQEERSAAVQYYLEHGKNYRRTCAQLGHPCCAVLKKWVCIFRMIGPTCTEKQTHLHGVLDPPSREKRPNPCLFLDPETEATPRQPPGALLPAYP